VTWGVGAELVGDGIEQIEVLDLDRALLGLAQEDAALAQIIEMHYFGGMTAEEVGTVLGRTPDAVRHNIRLARAWLRRELRK
jgi:DNA-directed RNA polymerase specialized sigma24 family protein